MSKWPEDYIENVLDDIANSAGVRKIKKAGLIERYTIRYCSPKKLHPNPNDEFSFDDVGPNFEIIGRYSHDIKNARLHNLEIFEEPVIVEKLEDEGYQLLNGHHRWFAALRMSVEKIHIHIVNIIHADTLKEMITKTENSKRVTFDLDEVLLTSIEDNMAPILDQLFSRRIKERIRLGAPEVIKEFQAKGYDVWVYTAGYLSEEYINDFFSMYRIEINGIVNGVNEKRSANKEEIKRVRQMMADKYKSAVHIDNESVLLTNPGSDVKFEQFDILDKGDDWSGGILNILNEF